MTTIREWNQEINSDEKLMTTTMTIISGGIVTATNKINCMGINNNNRLAVNGKNNNNRLAVNGKSNNNS